MMFDTQSNTIRPAGRTARRRPGGRGLQNVGLTVALISASMILCSSAAKQSDTSYLKKFISEECLRKYVSKSGEALWLRNMHNYLVCLVNPAMTHYSIGCEKYSFEWPRENICCNYVTKKEMVFTEEDMLFIYLCTWGETMLCEEVKHFIYLTKWHYKVHCGLDSWTERVRKESIFKNVYALHRWIDVYTRYHDDVAERFREDVATVKDCLAKAKKEDRERWFMDYEKREEITGPLGHVGQFFEQIPAETSDPPQSSPESPSSGDRKRNRRRPKRGRKGNSTRKPTSWSSIFWTSAAIVVVLTVIVTLAPHIVSIAQMWG